MSKKTKQNITAVSIVVALFFAVQCVTWFYAGKDNAGIAAVIFTVVSPFVWIFIKGEQES